MKKEAVIVKNQETLNNAGFTLIELLVVVLIIGILVAVALPQYQLAVDKAKFHTIYPLAVAVKNAQEVYYLANGAYATELNDLDVTFPADWTINGNRATKTGGYNVAIGANYITANMGGLNNSFVIYYDKTNAVGYNGRRFCFAYGTKERPYRLCHSLTSDPGVENVTCGEGVACGYYKL